LYGVLEILFNDEIKRAVDSIEKVEIGVEK